MALSDSREVLERAVAPQAVITPHPLIGGKRLEFAVLRDGETLEQYLRRISIDLSNPVLMVRLAGARVPREMWRFMRPRHGQLIEVYSTLRGDGENKEANFVLKLLVTIASIYVGDAYGALAGATTLFAGNLAVDLIVPVRPRSLSDGRDGGGSPTYALTELRNRARPYEPLPLVLGKFRVVPDYAVRPYTEFEGDDQYLYAVFSFGIGDLVLESMKIGDTPITDYAGVTTEVADPRNGALTLVAGNVDTQVGGTLTAATSWVTRTGSVNTTSIALDIEGLLYKQDPEVGIVALTATIEAEYRKVGDITWLPFFPSGTAQASSYWVIRGDATGAVYGFDTNLSATAHVAGDPAPAIDNINAETGATGPTHWEYVTVAFAVSQGWPMPDLTVYSGSTNSTTLISASTKPIRTTYRRDFDEAAQYEVRVRRASPDETDVKNTSTLIWSVMRSYQVDTATYNGQKRVAVKIKASGQLNGVLDTFNAVASRRCQVWTGAAWTTAITSNPAWLFLYVAQGLYVDSRLVVGAGLSATRIDFDNLKAWATFCTTKGLAFNGAIDREMAVGDVLDLIASAGRASKTWATGKLGVVWDADNLPVTAVVNMSNVLPGSFRLTYITEAPADEMVGVFINAANNYAQEEVRKLRPGVTVPARSQRIELFGVTDQAQAAKAINLRVASGLYRRKLIQWEQDFEGLSARRGEVVALSHDVTQWGYAGRIVSVAVGGSTVFTLDRKVPANLTTPGDTWIGVRVPGEAGYRILRVSITGTENDQVTLVDAWPVGVDLPGATRPALDYLYIYDFKATPGFRVKIYRTEPRMNERGVVTVRISAVPDVPEYYAAESGTFTAVAPATRLSTTPSVSGLVFSQQFFFQDNTLFCEVTATWSANDAFYRAEVLGTTVGAQVTLGLSEPGRRRFTWRALPGEVWTIAVRPYNSAGQPGATVSAVYTVAAPTPPPNVDFFDFTQQSDGTRQLSWGWLPATPKPSNIEGAVIRWKLGATSDWDAMAPFQTDDGFFAASPLETNQLAKGTYTLAIRARDTNKVLSTTALFITAVLDNPRLGDVLADIDEAGAGWPGTRTSCFIDALNNWVEANDASTWATVPGTWDAWTRWNWSPASPIVYTTTAFDAGAVINMLPFVQVDALGTVVIEESHSDDNVTYTAWAAIGTSFSARYVKRRATVTATGGQPVPIITKFSTQIRAAVVEEYVNDINPAALAGALRIGTGDVRVPITKTYVVITAVLPVVQAAAAGDWSVTVVDKNTSPGPRIQFRNAGVLADPTKFDAYVRGA